MRARIILCHPEPLSLNGGLARFAEKELQDGGWIVTARDLHKPPLDPVEAPEHFRARKNSSRFQPAYEQKHAFETGTVGPDIRAEIDALDATDLLILQFPLWWYQAPAMLKGWFDRVLTYGEVYSSSRRFDTGRFRGKRAMLSVTTGGSAASYGHDGRNGDIDLLLWPLNFSLHYMGYSVLPPFIVPDADELDESGFATTAAAYAGRLRSVAATPPLRFNGPVDWTTEGRLKAEAVSHGPFSRHTP